MITAAVEGAVLAPKESGMVALAVVVITAAMLSNKSTAVLTVIVPIIIAVFEATVLVSKESGMLAVAVVAITVGSH